MVTSRHPGGLSSRAADGKSRTSARLAAWARLAPGDNESAGKRKKTTTRKGDQHLHTAMIESAWTTACTPTRPGARFRRLARRFGRGTPSFAVEPAPPNGRANLRDLSPLFGATGKTPRQGRGNGRSSRSTSSLAGGDLHARALIFYTAARCAKSAGGAPVTARRARSATVAICSALEPSGLQ